MSELLDCNACGKCCKKYGGGGGLGSIDQEEYDRLPEFAQQYAYQIGRFYDIWIVDGNETIECPFLINLDDRTSKCMIYEDRPEVCRAYPDGQSTDGMRLVKCEMIPEFRAEADAEAEQDL